MNINTNKPLTAKAKEALLNNTEDCVVDCEPCWWGANWYVDTDTRELVLREMDEMGGDELVQVCETKRIKLA